VRDAENNPKQAIAEDSFKQIYTHTHKNTHSFCESYQHSLADSRLKLSSRFWIWRNSDEVDSGKGKGSVHHTRFKYDRAVLSWFLDLLERRVFVDRVILHGVPASFCNFLTSK